MTLLALAVTGRGLVDPDTPVLHADDEALLRGRAAFETLRVYGGRPFRLDAHLDRLEASSARIGLAPLPRDELAELADAALAAAGEPDVVLRFLWTAGREGGDPRRPGARQPDPGLDRGRPRDAGSGSSRCSARAPRRRGSSAG